MENFQKENPEKFLNKFTEEFLNDSCRFSFQNIWRIIEEIQEGFSERNLYSTFRRLACRNSKDFIKKFLKKFREEFLWKLSEEFPELFYKKKIHEGFS